jgi:hypothetical protein
VQGVVCSNHTVPTNRINELGQPSGWPFSFLTHRVRPVSGLSGTRPLCNRRLLAGLLDPGLTRLSLRHHDLHGGAESLRHFPQQDLGRHGCKTRIRIERCTQFDYVGRSRLSRCS